MESMDLAPGGTGVISLPPPRIDGKVSVEAALRQRRSVRVYGSGGLTLAEVGQLLWAAQGVTSRNGLRTAPSAGALYPLEAHLIAADVAGLAPGIYRYHTAAHSLVVTLADDDRAALCRAALSQSAIREAPATVILSAVFARTAAKYGQRGEGYVRMEAGHAAQNLYLQATALGLGTVAIGAFDDGAVARALSLPANESPLYIMPVGRLP